jgi:hypothetical protein
MGARRFEARIEDPRPATAPRFQGVAHLAAFVALACQYVTIAFFVLPQA